MLATRIGVGATEGPDGRLYIVGGLAGDGTTAHVTALVEAFDPGTRDVYSSAMPTPRSSPLVATGPDGKIYVAGGSDDLGNALDTFEVLDLGTGAWSSLAPMPAPSPTASGGFIGNRLYVLTWLSAGQEVQIYDLSTQSWYDELVPMGLYGSPATTTANGLFASLVPPQVSAASTPDGGLVFALFDPDAGAWSQSPPSPPSMNGWGLTGYGAGVAAGDGVLYVVGGTYPGAIQTWSMQSYTVGGQWEDLPHMFSQRGSLTAAMVGSDLYAIDGEDPSGFLGRLERYHPATKTWNLVDVACQRGSFDGGPGGCMVTPPPADGGVCGGAITESMNPLALSGGAFQVLGPHQLLIRLEPDCALMCSNPLSLCGEYQWLDLVVIAPAIAPGTYSSQELSAANIQLAETDAGMSLGQLTYLESLGQSTFNQGVMSHPGGFVTVSAISATQVSGSYQLLMPEVADGGEVMTDAGCPVGHPTCPLYVQHSGSFTVPAADCTLQTNLPPL